MSEQQRQSGPQPDDEPAQPTPPENEQAADAGQAPADDDATLHELREEAERCREQALRAHAELENVRKRAERDVANAHKFALERFAGELLGVRDSLEMGLSAAEDDGADATKLHEGMELTRRMLAQAMEKFGVEAVNPEGEAFNPDFHEAISTQPTSDVAPNTVVQVVQRGYLLNGRVLRPAMVVVSKAADGDAGQGA
ncbi:nucleotide exchange factor GrpE [Salinisphaera sp. P385]|uniref:Protein GrpE n=1 Tax=Spectribacter acetivorans TaxID=3075603 RepID=A0ABU3B7M2_9GAMM|nr:nucleotide exchange factor GrpE [Salinisphaera sp. P385]MDT0617822.1 nucleotide exchange factor GrpE [Salinisphaera sp. P385]